MALWAQVTDTPLEIRINVFKNGIDNMLKALIEAGGQISPSSNVGDNLEWKKAQKKEKKNIISDTINNNIPIFIPVATDLVCRP